MARPSRSVPKSTTLAPQKPQHTPSRSLRSRKGETSKHFERSSDDRESSLTEDKAESTLESNSLSEESEEEEPPKKKSKVKAKKGSAKILPKKVVSRGRSSKRNPEESGEEEPWETFIPKEDTPDSGDVPYDDAKIHPNTLQFLNGILGFD